MAIRHFTAAQIIDPDTKAYYRLHSTLSNIRTLHTHEYFELHYVLSGTLLQGFSDGHSLEHPTGTLLFIRPDDAHVCLSPNEKECQYINLAFSVDTVQELIQFLGVSDDTQRLFDSRYPQSVLLTDNERHQFLSRFEKIAILPIQQKDRIKTQLRSLLAEAIIGHFAAFDCDYESDKPAWLLRLHDDMQRKENFIQGTKRMVQLSGKSHHHICREFKKHYGQTPTDFLNHLRLNYAANMLAYSLGSVTDIALDLNFNNLSHFHHIFKKNYGMTPYKYRKGLSFD